MKDVANAWAETTPIIDVGGVGYFVTNAIGADTVLWRTDGSAGGTYAVKTLAPATPDSFEVVRLLTANGRLFISSYTYATASGTLWVSDGTSTGTRVLDSHAMAVDQYSHTNAVEAVGNSVFYVNGRDLMKTDGTEVGTVLVKRINPDAAKNAYPASLARVNNTLYFLAGGGMELWRSDGTGGGTTLVKQVFTYAPSANLTGFGNTLFFYAAEPGSPSTGNLYRSDGTAAGTVPVKRLDLGYGTHQIDIQRIVNGKLYFEVLADAARRGLWATDGTDAGTQRLTTGYGEVLGALGSSVFLGADNGTGIGRELLRTDGTTAGTSLVKDVSPSDDEVAPRPIGENGGFLYFSAADEGLDGELWRTDGTAAGTMLAGDLIPGSNGSAPHGGDVVGGALLFFANTAAGKLSLWRVTSHGGTIAGQVFNDPSGDGVRQPSELGLAGWRVFIDGDDDGVCDKGEPQTRTDSAGRYALDGVPPGTYRLRITPIEGWHATTGSAAIVTVKPGAAIGYTFGVRPDHPVFGTVSGFVFDDGNGDGILHAPAGEAGLAGYRVFLDLNFDERFDAATEPATRSGADGSYAIEGVAPGRYHVAIVRVGGDRVMTTPHVRAVTVRADLTAVAHYGVRHDPYTGIIHGSVFVDANANAMLDDLELPAEGFRVFLDENDNGLPDAGEPSMRTGANGAFSFTGLAGGTYRLRQVNVGGDWQPTTTPAQTITLPIAGSATQHFGNRLIHTGTVRGKLHFDANANGLEDPTEYHWSAMSATPPPRVYVDLNRNGTFNSGEPAAQPDRTLGDFSIRGVPPGTFPLRIILPDSTWRITTPAAETTITMEAGGNIFKRAYLVQGNASIRGTVYDELNRNLHINTGEPPIANVGVYLDLDNDGKRDASEALVVTGIDGRYEFASLLPGNYHVRLNGLPAGISALRGTHYSATVEAGGTSTKNFALVGSGRVRGVVFWDLNANGSKGGLGEDPFTDQLVYVDDDDDGVFDPGELFSYTNRFGFYVIVGVPAGEYVLRLAPDGRYGNDLQPQREIITVAPPTDTVVHFPQLLD